MEFNSYVDLKLPPRELAFAETYIPLLDKPLRIGVLPDDFPNYANMCPYESYYEINLRLSASKDIIDMNFCHELFHAYQLTCGFPMVAGKSEGTSIICEHLRSDILDLSDNEALKEYGICYDSIVNERYQGLLRLRKRNFSDVHGDGQIWLVLDLLLDLAELTQPRQQKILSGLQTYLPIAYEKFTQYHALVFDNFAYRTKEGCLKIYGEIITDIHAWGDAAISFNGRVITDRPTFLDAMKAMPER